MRRFPPISLFGGSSQTAVWLRPIPRIFATKRFALKASISGMRASEYVFTWMYLKRRVPPIGTFILAAPK